MGYLPGNQQPGVCTMSTGASLLLVTFVLWPLPLSRHCAQGSLALDGTYGFGSIFAEHGSPCGGAPTFNLVGSDQGQLTFYPDGTYSIYVTAQVVCETGASFNLTDSGPGTYVVDGAGRITLNPGTPDEEHLVLRPDLRVAVTAKDTSAQEGPYLALAMKLSSGLDDSVLNGSYRFGKLGLTNDGTGTQGEIWNGTMTFDGAGSVILDYLEKSVAADGTTTVTSSAFGGTYSVATDGLLSLGGMNGSVTSDGSVFALIDSLGQDVGLLVGVPAATAAGSAEFEGEWGAAKMSSRFGVDPALPEFCSELADIGVTAPTSSFTLLGVRVCEDTAGTSEGPTASMGSYSVAPDGTLTILESGSSTALDGAVDPTGTLAFVADTTVTADASMSFLVRKGTLPTPYGTPTSGTGGLAPTLGSSGGFAFLGNPDFAFEIDQALPGAAAFLACSVAPGTGLPLFGGMAWFDPSTLIFVQPFTLASVGSATVSSPIPADPPLDGANIHVQIAVLDPGAGAGISMTAGLKVPLRR